MIERLQLELREQWASSGLLRLGTWAIGAILLLYAALWLDDELTLKQIAWQRETAALENLRSLQDDTFWSKQASVVESQHQALLEQTWTVDTGGLAKAVIREAIDNLSTNTIDPVEIRRVEFGEPQPISRELWTMTGQITAALEDGVNVPWDWLARLESYQPLMIIDTIDIRVGTRKGVFMVIDVNTPLTGLESNDQ